MNDLITLDLPNEEASASFAKQLALYLSPPLIMAFSGDLGTGKTTLIRAMLQQLGISCPIKSPTFSLVESYILEQMLVHHFDLYRIEVDEELEYLGFRDYFTSESICCIEWAENAGKALPKPDIRFNLRVKDPGREMHIEALSESGKRIVALLMGEL